MTTLKTFSHLETSLNFICESLQGKKITYTYDSMNRRVARTDENGTTQYLYGNPNHPFQLTAVRSPSGSLSCYHYDDFGLLFALERDNNWYYITTDQLGTPRVVCDANGEVVKVLEYDSFGQVIADSNPEFELHISFAGGLIDVDTELVRFGFRDYDAVAGKWTAKDPIGFAGGDGNLYRYVGNASVKYTDPLGLDPIDDMAWFLTKAWYCGPGRDGSKVCPADSNLHNPTNPSTNAQNEACRIHDITIAQSGRLYFNLLSPEVNAAHWNLVKSSPNPWMKLTFLVMSIGNLPGFAVGLVGRTYSNVKNWTEEQILTLQIETQNWLIENGYLPPNYR